MMDRPEFTSSRDRNIEWLGDSKALQEIRAGSEIELLGTLEQGAFKPNIIASEIKLLGMSALPAPKQVSAERLLSGSEVTERVEAGGVV